jgi:hypothetical protein
MTDRDAQLMQVGYNIPGCIYPFDRGLLMAIDLQASDFVAASSEL